MTATSNEVASRPETVLGEQENTLKQVNQRDEETLVALSSLSEMTGFPVDFIKSELLVDQEELSMSHLRRSMASYLEDTFSEVQN